MKRSKIAGLLLASMAALEPAASQGVDALRSKVRDLGKSCKGCHDTFRAE